MRKQSTDNIRTSMNERIHFFIKIYLSHFILEKVMFLVCERWVETRADCYFDLSSADQSSTSSSSWLGLLNRGSLRAQSCWFSIRHLVLNWFEPSVHLVILLFNIHLLPLIYTGASLDWRLGRGSVYNTRTEGKEKINPFVSETTESVGIIIIILFTNPSARAGYDTKSIFKRSLTSLNSEFSFS